MSLRSFATRFAVTLLVGMVPVLAGAQARTDGTETWTPSRGADGRPDLQGVWDFRTITPLQRPARRATPRPDRGYPDPVRIAHRRRAEHRPVRYRSGGIGADGPEDRGLAERCILGFNSGPPMVPSGYNNNMQLFQNADHVVILNEMVHDARVVPLDGRPHLPEDVRQWMGDSRGHWSGARAEDVK